MGLEMVRSAGLGALLGVVSACGVEAPSGGEGGGSGGATVPEEWRVLTCEALPEDAWPPCLRDGGGDLVIASVEDYEQARRDFAPQGAYVDFDANGVQQTFELPYEPLDADDDGILGPGDLVIYVEDMPLLVEIDGTVVEVDADPIRMEGDEILIFSDEPPYTADASIHYEQVFSVDPQSGAVTFTSPPQAGSRVSLSASRTLHDEYGGRACSMADHDFSTIVVGRRVEGNGCLLGFDAELYFDDEAGLLVSCARRDVEESPAGCSEIGTTYLHWCAVEAPVGDYEVVFTDAEDGCLPQ